jgi:minor extracellular serine protease Vpr
MKKFFTISLIVVLVFSIGILKVSSESQQPKILGQFAADQKINLIVELNKPPVSVYKNTFKYRLLSFFNRDELSDYATNIGKAQSNFAEKITSMNGEVNLKYDYLFNGFSCTVPGKYVSELQKDPDVKNVSLDSKVYLQGEITKKVVSADIVNTMKDSAGKLITGNGIVVGVIDTGVDYNDKELGGGGFPNSKVIGGYDFADSSPDPMDTEGHGTHVAGIIAGSVNGIAPSAKIRAYKVFSAQDDSTSVSLIMDALDQAAKDKCDIVNISIGTDTGAAYDDDPESVAVRNAVNDGVVVVAAAGNEGSRSDIVNFPISSPASVDQAIGVGATNDSINGIITAGGVQIIGTYPGESPYFVEQNYQLVYCGYGEQTDFAGKDLTGKIALVQRGKIYFGDKDLNAKAVGASGIIVFNNVSSIPNIALQSQNNPSAKNFIPFLFVSSTDGRTLTKSIGQSVSISNKYGLGMIADFSANGPTLDFDLKPDIVAPGVNVESTYLNDTYVKLSGTSMASPVVAGVSALVKQAKPGLSAALIKADIMNTADILVNSASQMPFSPLMQGAGRINALNAVNSSSIVTPASFMFGNGNTNQTETFTVQNFSNSSMTFFTNYKSYPENNINVKIPFSITVPANGSSTVSVSFSAVDSTVGGYGFLNFTGGSNDKLHIPFVYLPNLDDPSLLNDVRETGSVVSPGKPINIDFNIGMGALYESGSDKFRTNLAEEVKVNVYNSSGNLVRTIFDRSPAFVGDYSIPINSVDSTGMNYYYPNGNYICKVIYVGANDNAATQSIYPDVTEAEAYQSFSVSGSPTSNVSLNVENNITPLLNKGDKFAVDVELNSTTPSKSFNLTINYDPYILQASNVAAGSAISGTGGFSYTMQPGSVFISLSSDTSGVVTTGTIASIQFQAIGNGEGFISVNSVTAASLEKFVLGTLYYDVSDYSKMYDLNGDDTVNSLDLNIFKASFGAKSGDSNFNKNCDFNFDGVVDNLDFFMFSKHFGEVYP